MIFIITCAVLGGLWALYDTGDGGEGFWGAICGATAGFVLALIVGACVYAETEEKVVGNVPLVSLADGSGVQGSFSFLGSGSIEDRPVFTWYQKSSDNAYVRKYADADESVIHYLSSKAHPRLIVRQEADVTQGSFKLWGMNISNEGAKKYHFYVPRGSIVQRYDLDNQ